MFICNFHPDHKKCLFDGTRIASYCTTGKREVLQCWCQGEIGVSSLDTRKGKDESTVMFLEGNCFVVQTQRG